MNRFIKAEKPLVSVVSNLISSNFQLIIGLISGVIIARALGPETKGVMSNLQLIITLYAPIFMFGYAGGVRFYGLRKIIDIQSFFWTGFLVVFMLGVLSIFIINSLISYGLFGKILESVDKSEKWLILYLIPLSYLNVYMDRVIKVRHLFRVSNFILLTSMILPALFYAILWRTIGISLKYALIGIWIGKLSAFCTSAYFIWNVLSVKWKLQIHKKFHPFVYGWKNWLNQLISSSSDKLDLIMLSYFLTPSAFGLYAVGVGVSNLLAKVPSSYVGVFYNQVSQLSMSEGLILYKRTQRITFILTFLAAALLALIAHPLVRAFYGIEYIPSAQVVVLYTPGLIFQIASRVTIKFFAGQGRPLKNSLIYLAGIVGGLPFYYILIPKYGLLGAAVASSLAYFFAFLVSFWQISRDYHISIFSICLPRLSDFAYILNQIKRITKLNQGD